MDPSLHRREPILFRNLENLFSVDYRSRKQKVGALGTHLVSELSLSTGGKNEVR